jgi:phospholipase C
MASQDVGLSNSVVFTAIEGNKVRLGSSFVREQHDAAIAYRAEFGLEFFGMGGNATIALQVTTRHRDPQTTAFDKRLATRQRVRPLYGRVVATPQRTARGITVARVNTDPLDPYSPFDPLPPIFIPPQPPPPTGGGGGFLHAQVQIQLFIPGVAEAVATWQLPEEIAGTYRKVVYNPPGFPAPDSPVRRLGWWRVVVTPTGGEPAMVSHLEAQADLGLAPILATSVSTRLFNHVFRVALEALVPQAYISGSTLTVQIGDELAALLGRSPVVAQKDISPIVSQAKLRSLNITAVSGREAKAFAQKMGRVPDWLSADVMDDDIALHIQAAFSNTDVSVYGVDLGKLDGEFGSFFLCFNRDLTRMIPLSFLKVQWTDIADDLLDLAQLFIDIPDDVVDVKFEEAVRDQSVPILTHFRNVLSRACGQHAALVDVSYQNSSWLLRYFNEPQLDRSSPRHPSGYFPIPGGDATSVATLAGVAPADVSPPSPPLPPLTPSDAPGNWPPEFVVASGDALDRLDRHQSIVVIMMENRSFDHMLGGLATARPRAADGYDGPPAHSSNLSAGGFLDRVPLVTARDIALGTRVPVEVDHDYPNVRFQMSDGTTIGDGTPDPAGIGAMACFARDLATIHDAPQLAMTVNGESELPIYYELADRFLVCNRWFSAHPGPTWPNRFATVMGSIPELVNFENSDPRIGYFQGRSIFEVLTSYGIEWRLFESDLSLIRMFDRYRLDDQRVLPIDDPEVGLDATLRSPGSLPRVMFIEPNFTDIPPLATASDDHPPSDLAAGQAFIARVCDAIWSANRFQECLVVITYDEHGGFFDHVPPPGTPKAPPVAAPVPKIHPDGPSYLGVRVPAFVLSPYVSAGKTDNTVFDHTSIVKTILVHNRATLPGSVLPSFGARVNASAHLGQVLDLAAPRSSPQPFDPKRRAVGGGQGGGRYSGVVWGGAVVANEGGAGGHAQAGSLPPRSVKIVPGMASIDDPGGKPRDFHTALRHMFVPR